MNCGAIVKSLAGHDKDEFFVVIAADSEFAFIVDGKNKTLAKPKKKKYKHLEETGKYAQLSAYNPLYDAHIRKELKSLLK